MILHRRRESLAGEQFSFASSKNSTRNDPMKNGHVVVDHDPVEFDAWAERTKAKNRHFGSSDDIDFGAWTRRFNSDHHDHVSLCSQDDDERNEAEDSGTPSPQFWKGTGSSIGNSAISRAEEIEKFRQEMLEMVRHMPESSYELSLRDMVESPSPRLSKRSEQRTVRATGQSIENTKNNRKKSRQGVRRVSRSDSMDVREGFLLKMFTPAVSVGGGVRRMRTRSAGSGSTSSKVSPRPSFSEAEKSSESEWWKRNEPGGSGNSSNSSSSSTKSR